MDYICNERKSIMTKRGVIGPPIDPGNPTTDEIITAKDFINGEKDIQRLLAHKNKPIIPFVKVKKNTSPESTVVETSKTNTKSQTPEDEKNKITKGAEKK